MDLALVFKSSSVFAASFLGSFHCIAMCGGLMLNAGKSKLDLFFYHGFRLLGYVLLGTIAGLAGNSSFTQNFPAPLELLFALILSSVLFYSGLSLLLKNTFPEFKIGFLSKLSAFAMNLGNGRNQWFRAGSIGLFTALLPCGWLYSHVATAASSQTVQGGAMVMVFFWLGTLPALILGRKGVQYLQNKWELNANRWIAVVFILMGFFSLYERLVAMGHVDNHLGLICL